MWCKNQNLEYIQFHPTAFNSDDGEQFLISESVRGEEHIYLTAAKNDLWTDMIPGELAPRDVVSMSIILESRLPAAIISISILPIRMRSF